MTTTTTMTAMSFTVNEACSISTTNLCMSVCMYRLLVYLLLCATGPVHSSPACAAPQPRFNIHHHHSLAEEPRSVYIHLHSPTPALTWSPAGPRPRRFFLGITAAWVASADLANGLLPSCCSSCCFSAPAAANANQLQPAAPTWSPSDGLPPPGADTSEAHGLRCCRGLGFSPNPKP